MKKRNKILYIMIFAFIVLILISYIFPNLSIVEKAIFLNPKKNIGVSQTITLPLNKETFPLIIQSQSLIQELPKSAIISLKLYNTERINSVFKDEGIGVYSSVSPNPNKSKEFEDFNSEQRAIEESYIVTKGKVIKGEAVNPDISVQIHSKYISEAEDICSAIKKAKTNGDLGYDLHSSKASLLFKYSSMMKYNKCF